MKYKLLYEQLKKDIEGQNYHFGEKLPSIRKMMEKTGYSKTTIESAYNQLLVEGYIQSRNKSGYYIDVEVDKIRKNNTQYSVECENLPVKYKYDFTGKAVAKESFNLNVWQKYLKKVMNDSDLLFTYGDTQGELELRKSLCKYSNIERGVVCKYNQIIIGSGFQSLLQIICGFLNLKTVAMPQSGFDYAKQVFYDHQIEIKWIKEDEDGILIDDLTHYNVDLIYINSSVAGINSKALPISRRLTLIDYAKKNDILILEDDYNGELRYRAKPIMAMQSNDENSIIYIGSFSKLLIPSIRLSYMVLPVNLLKKYKKSVVHYHQTVSKFEQLALCYYIQDGGLNRQLKKLRRLYLKKSQILIEQLKKFDIEELILEETALRIKIKFKHINVNKLLEVAKSKGINFKEQHPYIILSFSSINYEDIVIGIEILYNCYLYVKENNSTNYI